MANSRRWCEIRELNRFRQESQSLGIPQRDLDEVLGDILWALARNPTLGELTNEEPPIRGLLIEATPKTPRLVLYWFHNDTTVSLLSILRDED